MNNGCNYCNKEHSLLSGEDWAVFIRDSWIICMVAGELHDHKHVAYCPICGRQIKPTVFGETFNRRKDNE